MGYIREKSKKFFLSADQSVLSSPIECVGSVNGQGTNETPGISLDGGGVQSAPWPGYDMTYDDLKTRVRHQLEYYFSR